MLKKFSNQHSHQLPVRSTLLGCLVLSSVLLPAPSTSVHSKVSAKTLTAQQSNQLPTAKAIAEQVRQEAIAKEKLEKSAKVIQIERVRKEIWMYNPVPYWKITIADQRQTLVYFTNDTGKFRVLMQRNGKPTHPMGKPAREIPPPDILTAVIRQAKEWGYPGQLLSNQLSAEKAFWTRGCENLSMPYPCDQIGVNGWKITVPNAGSGWVFRGENEADLRLIERSNPSVERRLPAQVLKEVKRIGGKHLQHSSAVVMVTKAELLTFSDSCLGLATLEELCAQQLVRGYRVTVVGKPKEQQIYRISNDARNLRIEAIAGLPVRTDELPTAIARKIFTAAQIDLKQSIANLGIRKVEATFACIPMPTAAPTDPCLPTTTINGWKVTVTNYQKSITYTVDLNGKVLAKR